MCLRCYLADMERRGVLLTRSLLSWPRWRWGYLLNMPRPVWQPSHYIRPVISLKLLHSKWLSRVRVICLSTGELEGGGDLDPLLFVSQLNLRLLMMILNKGKIFSSRENYLSNIGTTTTSFLTKGSSPFRIFGKSKEFVPTGRTYGVLEHPKLKEICLFCCILQGIIHCSALACWVPCSCFHRPKRFSWLEGFSGQKEVVMKRDLYACATTCKCYTVHLTGLSCTLR